MLVTEGYGRSAEEIIPNIRDRKMNLRFIIMVVFCYFCVCPDDAGTVGSDFVSDMRSVEVDTLLRLCGAFYC